MRDDSAGIEQGGGSGPPGRPVEPGADEEAPDEVESDQVPERRTKPVPIGKPVDEETYAELKRRAEQPETSPEPPQEDRG